MESDPHEVLSLSKFVAKQKGILYRHDRKLRCKPCRKRWESFTRQTVIDHLGDSEHVSKLQIWKQHKESTAKKRLVSKLISKFPDEFERSSNGDLRCKLCCVIFDSVGDDRTIQSHLADENHIENRTHAKYNRYRMLNQLVSTAFRDRILNQIDDNIVYCSVCAMSMAPNLSDLHRHLLGDTHLRTISHCNSNDQWQREKSLIKLVAEHEDLDFDKSDGRIICLRCFVYIDIAVVKAHIERNLHKKSIQLHDTYRQAFLQASEFKTILAEMFIANDIPPFRLNGMAPFLERLTGRQIPSEPSLRRGYFPKAISQMKDNLEANLEVNQVNESINIAERNEDAQIDE